MQTKIESVSLEPFNPKPLFNPISHKWSVYSQLRQQDSHELLCRLFDGIVDEFTKVSFKSILKRQTDKKRKCFVNDVFGGSLASLIVCDFCKGVTTTTEDYFILSLSIPAVRILTFRHF